MSMGGWHHRGANVTARVVVEPGWLDPAERWKQKLEAEIEARRLLREQARQDADRAKLDNKSV